MKSSPPATATTSPSSRSHEEELIEHLECLSAVLSDLRSGEHVGELPPWLHQGLREADHHLISAQAALQALQRSAL